MKRRQYILIMLGAIVVGVYIYALYKVGQVQEVPEIITCEERYIGDSYVGIIKWKDGDYIYLSGTHELDTICTPYEEEVNEETPLCGTKIPFEGPLDTSNMNCYYDNPKSKLKAFKKRMEDEKEEQKKYYACVLDTERMVSLFNSCSEVECARYRMSEYLKEACPRAVIK